MSEFLFALKHPFFSLKYLARPHSSVEQDSKAAARKFRAGTRKIMTAAERQAFLRDSEYGRMAGVSKK